MDQDKLYTFYKTCKNAYKRNGQSKIKRGEN